MVCISDYNIMGRRTPGRMIERFVTSSRIRKLGCKPRGGECLEKITSVCPFPRIHNELCVWGGGGGGDCLLE